MVVRLVNGPIAGDGTYLRGSALEMLVMGCILRRSQYPYCDLRVRGHPSVQDGLVLRRGISIRLHWLTAKSSETKVAEYSRTPGIRNSG
ncbi:hypothetical protein AVEN_261702-1 [Araneus ventricosus]|uniref:Uncharacterized protein n=1 Tax=Araneus ventricosus TaxID=182803 RepID=A0A4Y2DWY6_ARAVE|nr:hypothetical protein AVEN_261702-1 [Araneus ventricosus]